MAGSTVRVKVWGDLACFSRPEMKVERVSYEVMTPSAARGVLDAILWRPEMRWNILKIEVLKPITFIALKRNELEKKITPGFVKAWMEDPSNFKPQEAGAGRDDTTQRNTLALKNVAYIIEAEPLVWDASGPNKPQKYIAMMNRNIEKGRCFVRPCLGCREFSAFFSIPGPDDLPISDSRELGLMLYDIAFDIKGKKHKAVFFNATMNEGVVETRARDVLKDQDIRREVIMCSYKR